MNYNNDNTVILILIFCFLLIAVSVRYGLNAYNDRKLCLDLRRALHRPNV